MTGKAVSTDGISMLGQNVSRCNSLNDCFGENCVSITPSANTGAKKAKQLQIKVNTLLYLYHVRTHIIQKLPSQQSTPETRSGMVPSVQTRL
jgi:hypothetical protein